MEHQHISDTVFGALGCCCHMMGGVKGVKSERRHVSRWCAGVSICAEAAVDEGVFLRFRGGALTAVRRANTDPM